MCASLQACVRRRCAQKHVAMLRRQQDARNQLHCAGQGASLETVKLAVKAAQSAGMASSLKLQSCSKENMICDSDEADLEPL